MSIVRVAAFTISVDGFASGEGQSLEAPFGHAGERLHEWMFPPETGGDTKAKYGIDGAPEEVLATAQEAAGHLLQFWQGTTLSQGGDS